MGGVSDKGPAGTEGEPRGNTGHESEPASASDQGSAFDPGSVSDCAAGPDRAIKVEQATTPGGDVRSGRSGHQGPDDRGSGLNRRRFIGMAAAVGAGAPVLLGGMTAKGTAQASRRSGTPVIISSLPLASPHREAGEVVEAIRQARIAGVDVVFVPVATVEAYADAARNLIRLRWHLEPLDGEAVLVRWPSDIQIARDSGRLAVVAHFQGMQMVLEDLPILDEFSAAGVGIMALTHNWKNWNGDGCLERTDLPLTGLGELAVDALNDLAVVLDLSRVGRQSSLQAMSRSRHPVIFSNSNAAAIHDHPRNLTDRQIDACADGAGVVCVTAFPTFVGSGRPTLDDLLAHVDYIVARAGIEHVGLGLGFTDRLTKRFPSDPLPDAVPPFPSGVDRIGALDDIRSALARRGYDRQSIDALFGGNLLRVLNDVWARS